MFKIPEHFDEHRPCPKCWWSPVSVRHCQTQWSTSFYGEGGRHGFMPCDHLHRECGRCGYSWIELPWDAKPWTQEEWDAAVQNILDDRQQETDRILASWDTQRKGAK